MRSICAAFWRASPKGRELCEGNNYFASAYSMVINWYGEACFKIQTGETVILTDPFSAEGDTGVGLTPPRLKADVTLRTLTALPTTYVSEPTLSLIEGPGEYAVKGVKIAGWQVLKENDAQSMKTVYRMEAEELRLGFLGHIGDLPEADVLERLGDVDVLFLPAGGAPYLDEEKAAKLARQMNAKVVIATLFKVPGLKRKAEEPKEFLKELEVKAEPQEKLVIKKKDLPTQVMVFLPRL